MINYFSEYSDPNDICFILLPQKLMEAKESENACLKFPFLLLSLFLSKNLFFSQKQKVTNFQKFCLCDKFRAYVGLLEKHA